MAPHPVRPRDLRKFVFMSDPQMSPDGSKVAYVHTSIDYEKNDYMKHIWIHDVDTGRDTQFTAGEGKDSNPRWGPSGNKLLFLSSGREPDKKNELFMIYASGGEAHKVAELETGISNPLWGPDEKTILFSSRFWEPKKPETDVVVVNRLWYKLNGVGMFAGKRIHLFTVKATGGKPKQITRGEFDVAAYSWSPNGKEVAYVTNKEKDQDASYVKDIYVMPSKGGEATKITEEIHEISSISWSKHGIAYFGSDFHARGATNTDIWIMKPGEEPLNITSDWDRSLERGIGSDLRIGTPDPGPVWSPDGSEIYFLTGEVSNSNVYKVNVASRNVEKLTDGVTVDGFSYSSDFRHIAYNAMTATEPCELYIDNVKATNFNGKHLKTLNLSIPEHYTWVNELGDYIDGWVMKPIDYKEGEKYPTILEIHGGPLGIYGEGIYQEFQLLTSDGYVVIYTNPRGSGGYGEEYGATLNGRHGTVDYIDVMDFTHDAIKRFSFIDPDRLGVTGGSYGGYLTNWIVTQTDLFKAAVACRSTCDRYSHHGYSDFGFKHGESGNVGYPWRDEDKLLAQSPLRFAKNVKTPTLLIHSENDLRCPIQQGEEFFVALMELGVYTELVRFPDETHELSRSGKPKHREERLQHILRWFDKYLK
jgi:dipeptidyl aminopeptidase/acylaminoacyl peptidase